MLEQYRHENPQEKDILSENGFQNPKRKLIFTLSGATLALVLFLLLMGTFRSDDQTEEQKQLASLDESQARNNQEQMMNQIKELQARVDKLENAPLAVNQQAAQTALADDITQENLIPQNNLVAKELQMMDVIADETQNMPETIQSPPVPLQKQTLPRTYTVQRGDTLSKISLRYFGTTKRWKDIYNANKNKITNINQLKVGTQLTIPEDIKNN